MIMLVVMSVLSAVGSDIWKKLPDWRWYLNGNGEISIGLLSLSLDPSTDGYIELCAAAQRCTLLLV